MKEVILSLHFMAVLGTSLYEPVCYRFGDEDLSKKLDYNNELYEKELLANYRKLIDGETAEAC